MTSKFIANILQIIEVLSSNEQINFNSPNLPTFQIDKISTPLGNIYPLMTSSPSSLPNQLPDFNSLHRLINQLSATTSIIRLDHVGFCYQVESSTQEKVRLINEADLRNSPIYQEPSNDDGLWLFAGNLTEIVSPVTEFVPIEYTSDPDKNYWLPHIQFDIDTKLSSTEILDAIKNIYGNRIIPFSFVIDGTTYIIRCRLGVIGGINIFLDLATNARNVTYLRQHIWQRIV